MQAFRIAAALGASSFASLFLSLAIINPVFADDASTAKQIELMQQEIDHLQAELAALKKNAAADKKAIAAATTTAHHAAVTAEQAAARPPASAAQVASDEGNPGGPVKFTVGGFTEAAGIYRQHNTGSDIATPFASIPFNNVRAAHLPEYRESSRQSRISLLAQGVTDGGTELTAYAETDFLGAAQTANSKQSNSYNLRLRQFFGAVDDQDSGWHVLGGQAWSMITLDKVGITARQENVPLTIDAQYVPGFTWTRNPQFRVVHSFDNDKIWAGLSLESPQAVFYGTAPAGTTATVSGGSLYFNTTAYSTDAAPDIIEKLAFDPGYGHYEVYALERFFTDRNNGSNSTVMGGGAGAGAIVPVIRKKLDFQISGLVGTGIGRYGTSQLPDVTFKPDGGLATVGEWQALIGLIGHPSEKWSLYTYAGTERARKTTFGNGGSTFGYGNPLYDNSGCDIEGSATCVGNTSSVSQITAGAWWDVYKGKAGKMALGLQDSYTWRDAFAGVGGAPSAKENVTMVSFRYYPF